jgi:hypothetical protein
LQEVSFSRSAGTKLIPKVAQVCDCLVPTPLRNLVPEVGRTLRKVGTVLVRHIGDCRLGFAGQFRERVSSRPVLVVNQLVVYLLTRRLVQYVSLGLGELQRMPIQVVNGILALFRPSIRRAADIRAESSLFL